MLSGPGPRYTDPYNYTWLSSGISAPALSFTMTDLAGVESDSRKTFLSGIALGIAGAALIGFAEELIRPLGERRRSGRGRPESAAEVQEAATGQAQPASAESGPPGSDLPPQADGRDSQ